MIAVVGPTATGKSDLALALCEILGGEVVNGDAMQLYRGMDIGTAKLAPVQRRGIPHHQLDVLHVAQEASVAAYQSAARRDLDAIRDRGAHPVLVGGSGLYVRAALDRLDIPPTDPAVRLRLEHEATERGAETMYAALRHRDPDAAARIGPANLRRVVRALEVIELTGRPFSATMPQREYAQVTIAVGLHPPRAWLDERIGRRVRGMWRDGLLDEVRVLDIEGLRHSRTASRALGYAQALAELDNELTGEQARADTTAATRRFARRQQSWFRPDPRITWFDPSVPGGLSKAVAFVVATVGDNGRHG